MADRIQEAVDLLMRPNQTARARNEAAIALADLGAKRAIGRIEKLLWLPETKGARGSLLYALAELGADLEPELLAKLLIEDGGEVQYECLRAIEAGRVAARGTIPEQAVRLREAAQTEKDEDRRRAIGGIAVASSSVEGANSPGSILRARCSETSTLRHAGQRPSEPSSLGLIAGSSSHQHSSFPRRGPQEKSAPHRQQTFPAI